MISGWSQIKISSWNQIRISSWNQIRTSHNRLLKSYYTLDFLEKL